MDPSSITVLVTLAGGPADGRTGHLPLPEATGEVTVDGPIGATRARLWRCGTHHRGRPR